MAAKKNENESLAPRVCRSGKNRVLAGVAGGLGEYFEVDPNLIRLIFVLLTLLGGSGLFLYAILWVFMPRCVSAPEPERADVSPNRWFPVAMILLGVFFLLNNFGLLWWFSLDKLWPLILILLGISIITNDRKSSGK